MGALAAPGSEELGALVVAAVGGATGARAAAAALACAGSAPDRSGLLIDLDGAARPRPSLFATGAARALEERLARHLPEHPAASRGRTCHLSLPPSEEGLSALARVLPIARDSIGVVHVRSSLLQAALERGALSPGAALLRADLTVDRSLAALAARDLISRGTIVSILKQPLGWLTTRLALCGALGPQSCSDLPPRMLAAMADGG